MTENQLKRVKDDWERYAKECIDVAQNKAVIEGFGSELATLRIFKKYNEFAHCQKLRQGYSENLKTFYVALEI